MERTSKPPLSEQMRRRTTPPPAAAKEGTVRYISTGSTLLDLAISGGVHREGGIPGGILVEIFGPASSGKTVLLCEIAGAIQRQGGEVRFQDPEARLNQQFATMFDLNVNEIQYDNPSTVVEAFKPLYDWKPAGNSGTVHGMFADSLAALSTDMEMGEGGDKYGMRRAKEFSQELRKVCRLLPERNILFVCSNQVRQNLDAGPYGQKFKSPGGEAIGFYSSLRLRVKGAQKIKLSRKVGGDKVARVIGVETEIAVHKSSIDKPFREATVYILFDYGIDDIRGNLQFVKQATGAGGYAVRDRKLDISLDAAIRTVENDGLEDDLREQTIELWNDIESKFAQERARKKR